MNCERSKPQKYWTDFGKRCAASGLTLEAALGPINPALTKVKEWISEGYAARLKVMAK
jgi:hypothetical protein